MTGYHCIVIMPYFSDDKDEFKESEKIQIIRGLDSSLTEAKILQLFKKLQHLFYFPLYD